MSTTAEMLAAGIRHHQAGQWRRAEAVYQQILQINPRHADALHLLGVLAHQEGDHGTAVERIRRAIAVRPRAAAFHSNLALAYKALGNRTEAVASCRRALDLDPGFAEAHNNLGNLLRDQGQLDEAMASYRRALDLRPDYAEACNNLGIALKKQGRLNEAAVQFRRAIEGKPRYAEAHNNLGTVLLDQDRLEEAEINLRQAIELDPDYAIAHNNLANVLKTRGAVDEAEAAYLHSLKLAPRNPDALGNLASLYERVNRLEDAAVTLAQGLDRFPDNPGLILLAARCDERRGRCPQAMDRLLHLRRLVRPNAKLSFQLARLYDRMGDYRRAFAEFTQANRLAQEECPAGPPRKESFLQNLDTFARLFHPQWVRSWTAAPPWDEQATPAFVIGFPRSGTTLLDVILDSHPQIQTLEEQSTVSDMYEVLQTFPGGLPEVIGDLSPPQVALLRETYFRTAGRFVEHASGQLLVDKLPLNTAHVGFILRVFPAARFLLVVRHPCDVCLSCFMQDFKLNIAMANFCTLEDTVRVYCRVMDLWRQYVRVLPHPYHVIRYEDLIDDFEAETRRALEFLGVGWHDAVRDYAGHAKGRGKISTPSYHQVVQPIYTDSRYRWLHYTKEFRPLMDRLEPYIEYFGYGDATRSADPQAA